MPRNTKRHFTGKKNVYNIVTAMILAVAVISTLTASSVFAGGAAGGGGGGSGGGGGGSGPYTWDGYGWAIFDTNGGTHPSRTRDGASWAYIASRCNSAGADKVVAYIIMKDDRNVNNSWIYNYPSQPDGWSGWHSGSAPWIDTGTANALYNQLSPADRSGTAWGSNLAWFCYSTATHWTVRAESYIKIVGPGAPDQSLTGLVQTNVVAKPGDRLNFAHDLRAQSDNIDKRVWYTIRGTGFPSTFHSGTAFVSGSVGPTIPNGSLFVAFGPVAGRNQSYMTYDVTQDDVGHNLCQAIEWQPTSWNNGNASSTTARCASVPYNYQLTPSVTNVPTAVQPGAPVTYTGSVKNSGPTKSRSTEWRLVKFTLPPNTAIPAGSTGSASPESYYGNGATKIAGATGKVFQVTNIQVTTGSSATPGLEPGSLVCFALSVAPYSHANSNWRYGIPTCAEVAKASYVSVSGGDLLVGRNTTPSPSATISVNRFTISGKTYGSWAEYGALAPSTSNIATGGNLATTTTRSTPAPSGNLGQPLTFANNKTAPTCTTIDGCFNNSMGSRTDLYTKYTTKPDIYTQMATATTINLSSLAAGNYYYKLTSPLSISGTLAKGVSVIIDTTGDVTITGDVKYNQGPYTQLSDLPQLILATSGNIRINNGVKQVDSWLYAAGTVSTCDAIQAPASYTNGLKAKGTCDKNPLVTNGPLSTGHLQLRRTYGAIKDQVGLEQPAESFNLRPDSYLWSYAQSQNPRLITTTFTRELPPRL